MDTFLFSRLFQHYRLHQFVFSHTQAEEIIGLDLTCELVPPANRPYPPPLVEGLSHDIWEKYVKTPPPSLPPETEVDCDPRNISLYRCIGEFNEYNKFFI